MDILHDFLLKFGTVFTQPAFEKFVRLIQGFISTHSPKAITELNEIHPQEGHFCGTYDFLNRYAWSHVYLAQILLNWLVETLSMKQRLVLVVDDTKVFKHHARKMEGICWHPEHHRHVQTKVKTETGEELQATGVVGDRGQQCCPHLYGSFVAYNWSLAGSFLVHCIVEKQDIGTVFHFERACLFARNMCQKLSRQNTRLRHLCLIHWTIRCHRFLWETIFMVHRPL